MLKLRKGSFVPLAPELSEGYDFEKPYFTANVNADKIEALLEHFVHVSSEPLAFILEIPTNQKDEEKLRKTETDPLHMDVYYIIDCSKEKALAVLRRTAPIMINDGLCHFGFGCRRSHDEIMVGKYNVVTLYTENEGPYEGFFEKHHIPFTPHLITAWETFTRDLPGESTVVETDGKSCFDIPDMLQDLGIFFGERREA